MSTVSRASAALLLVMHIGSFAWSQKGPSKKVLKQEAPDVYQVEFRTTKGAFVVEVKKEWGPLAANRFYQLVQTGFYSDMAIFRVQPGYVTQFGISDKALLNDAWNDIPIDDEPVMTSNLEGTVAFARDGPRTRTTQLFINLGDNGKLDTIAFNDLVGFPPFGSVIEGMDVVHTFYGEYGFDPAEKQDEIQADGNAYLRENYPNLDYILEAVLKD